MWLVLRDNSFNQWHIITDALKHRDETPSEHHLHKHTKHCEFSHLNEEGFELSEVLEYDERTGVQTSSPLLQLLQRETHGMGLLKAHYHVYIILPFLFELHLTLSVSVEKHSSAVPSVTGTVSVQSYWSCLLEPSSLSHLWWRPDQQPLKQAQTAWFHCI